jgi:hypothetical protein
MKKLKVISLVNFVRGGKSSLARLLAENFETSILNFDPKRDSEFYNAISTVNIPEDSKITKSEDKISLETSDRIIEIESKTGLFICDFGGRFDERINEFESDLYILPTMHDFESISETVKATKYILKHNPEAKIIHVLNMAMCSSKAKREDFKHGYKAIIERNSLSQIPSIEMPRSTLFEKMVNHGIKESDIIGDNSFLRNGGYRGVIAFSDKLIKLIKKEIN